LADTTTSLSTSFINEINEPVTKAPVIVETILASSSKNAPAESNIQTADINKIDISKVAFDKVNFIQIGVNPDSIGKITSSKPRTASQGAIIINRDTKVTSSKIDITPNEKLQIRLSQICIADNSFVHFDISQETPFQSNPTEVASTEIDSFIRSNPDIWKLSLPSGITSQQFLNSELFSQNSNPQVFNIESTAANIWSNPFNSTTPIKFNFDITNLPTGQLAEGTITSYNTNGTPNTATITIDDDANGVGWFIDSTPGDSSEFQGVGEYFQATPNSPAFGKYDLLTAILHEMGHTLGIINGYSEFDKHVKNGIFTTDTFTTKLTPDGKLTYQPIPTYVGNNSFTYLGFDTDGQVSNSATVNLTINNIPPTIQTIDIPTNSTEGAITTISATATDAGNDPLTYRWYINSATTPIEGHSIDYIW
jgi:hypothetical protein